MPLRSRLLRCARTPPRTRYFGQGLEGRRAVGSHFPEGSLQTASRRSAEATMASMLAHAPLGNTHARVRLGLRSYASGWATSAHAGLLLMSSSALGRRPGSGTDA
eukprot:13940426-Alexandrium_andersonii.AAC.1